MGLCKCKIIKRESNLSHLNFIDRVINVGEIWIDVEEITFEHVADEDDDDDCDSELYLTPSCLHLSGIDQQCIVYFMDGINIFDERNNFNCVFGYKVFLFFLEWNEIGCELEITSR